MQVVTTVGLDIAKSVFQVHGIDAAGQVVIRRQLKRRYVLAFFQKLPACLVGIEACASSHHWSRELKALGHTVRLMPPAYVKPYVKRQKNDAADAEAICEAVTRANMRFVATQSEHAPFKDASSVDTIGQSGLGPSMRRREFIALLGVTVVGPVPAFAQQPTGVRQVALLSSFNENSAEVQVYIAALREGLAKLGWEEGRNIHIEFRWAGSDTELTRRLAKEVVGLRPDLIIATNSPSTAMLLQLTRTIPIVFPNIVDPVGQGFASSLARPGGNATGLVNLEPSMAGKWIELLKQLMPAMSRVVVPYNPATTPYADLFLNYFKSTSTTLDVSINAVPLENMFEFEKIAGIQSQQPNTGFVPIPSAFMTGQAHKVGALMVQHRLPALYVTREFAASGGLISYGNDVSDNYRRAAKFVDRILKGESPSALPIELPIKFALIINLKTAKTLGLTVPLHMQQIADEVIE